jgi:hypothetical protein
MATQPAEQSAVERAAARGHKVEDDPPHALSWVRRWTCSVCGRAVLYNGGVVYGTAVEQDCEPRKTP